MTERLIVIGGGGAGTAAATIAPGSFFEAARRYQRIAWPASLGQPSPCSYRCAKAVGSPVEVALTATTVVAVPAPRRSRWP